MRRLLSLAMAIAACGFLAASPARADDRQVCDNNNSPLDAAIDACTRRINGGKLSVKDLSITYFNRGLRWQRKNDDARAFADFNEAVRIQPTYGRALASRGEMYRKRGEYDRALTDLNASIRADGKNAYAYFVRGLTWQNKGDNDRAIADYTESLRINPKDQVAFFNRGTSWQNKNEHDRAIADFDEAIRLNPRYAFAYNNRGLSWRRKNDIDRAIADYNLAIGIDPKYTFAINNRATALHDKREFSRAMADFNEVIRLDPTYTAALTNRGRLYEDMGDLDRARADYNAALSVPANYSNGKWAHDTARQRLAVLGPAGSGGGGIDVAKRVEPRRDEPRREEVRRDDDAPKSDIKVSGVGGKRVALVIGNSEYVHSTRLANPRNDAADIAETLRRLGFDVVEGKDLDRSGMDNVIRQFSRKLERVDVAAFFYAGHGLQVAGKNYLVPIDAKLERPGDLALDAVDINLVLAQMETESKVNLIFLDACRDNPLSRSLASKLGSARSGSVGQGLTSIQTGVGTLIAFATQPDNVALDGDGRNSPFTMALKKHLMTPGLDIGLIMRRVRQEVKQATRDKQIPWDNSSLTGEVVLLTR